MSGAMEKIKAKVENVLHKDKTHEDPTGPHSSHSANKADPRVDSDHIGTTGNHGTAAHGTTGTHTGTHAGTHTTGTHATGVNTTHGSSGLTGNTYGSDPTGPHDSRLGNKADPRVDSDHIGSTGNHGTTAHGTHGTTGTHATGINTTHGSSGLTGNTYGSDPTGPHDSRLGNKADPRVDSDRYGVAGNTTGTHSSGLTGTGHSGTGLTSNTHSHGTTGSGLTGTNYGSDPTGPHDSKAANKLDPRVDSTVPGSYGNSGGARQGAYGSDPTGPHDSHLGNTADPRVDSSTTGGYGNTHSTGGYGAGSNTHSSGLTGSNTHSSGLAGSNSSGLTGTGHGVGGLSSGPGPAENTAGPHKSDMLNKADPRVDSDLDGSKTYMGNKTSGI
ncbi:hypothetical protein PMIN06_000534 [Paraphaeosphaeria minitans]